MTRGVRGAIGTLGAAGVLALIRLGSFTPYTAERDVGAIVRFAWRARGERVNECRRRTPDELAKLPPHMRQEEVCEGRVLPYRLAVTLDGAAAVNQLIHGAGAKEDRPLYVFQDLVVSPGSHRVAVSFTREGAAPADTAGALATPARLTLDTTLTLGARRIVLVTYDEEREQLVVRGGSGGS
ncbi:MAG TPA: hypothetical protein VIV56_18285 [Gemmatimonadales bacterium]